MFLNKITDDFKVSDVDDAIAYWLQHAAKH